MNIKELSDKELIQLNKDVYRSVYIDECYGIKDLGILNQTTSELQDRGYILRDDVPVWTKYEKK